MKTDNNNTAAADNQEDVRLIFSERLEELMKDRELSDQKLASLPGDLPHDMTIRNWRRGKTAEGKPPNPTLLNLYATACAFNVSLDYLTGRTTEKTTKPDIKTAAATTGLNEEAVEKLQALRDNAPEPISPERISRIINTTSFPQLLFHLSVLIDNESPSDIAFIPDHRAAARARANGETHYTIDIDRQEFSIFERETFRAEKALRAIIAEIINEKEGG